MPSETVDKIICTMQLTMTLTIHDKAVRPSVPPIYVYDALTVLVLFPGSTNTNESMNVKSRLNVTMSLTKSFAFTDDDHNYSNISNIVL